MILTDQEFGRLLMTATIRLSLLCYLLGLFIKVVGRRPLLRHRTCTISWAEVLVWWAGAVFCLLHILIAFDVEHQWSHQNAFVHTAIETEKKIGVRRGEGIWVNYLFTMAWCFDAIRLTVSKLNSRVAMPTAAPLVHCLFAFVVFNATVVFGPAFYKWWFVPVGVTLTAAIWVGFRGKASADQSCPDRSR